MSCAFLNCGERCVCPAGPETSSLRCPYSVLANSLHAMAQPLTVLRGALGAWKLRGSMAAESDRYIEMSAKQVERMSELLSCMQEVLEPPESKPKCTRVDFSELLGLVLEGMCSELREWKGTIVRVGPSGPVYLRGDKDRTERALRAAIRVLISISAPGGSIWISVRPGEGQVEVKAEQRASHRKTLGFMERLNLSLVETNIRNQGGGYECVEDPLSIKFTLPAYSLEAMNPALNIPSRHMMQVEVGP